MLITLVVWLYASCLSHIYGGLTLAALGRAAGIDRADPVPAPLTCLVGLCTLTALTGVLSLFGGIGLGSHLLLIGLAFALTRIWPEVFGSASREPNPLAPFPAREGGTLARARADVEPASLPVLGRDRGRGPRRTGAAAAALIVVIAALLLARAAERPTAYDTGLYHLQAIRWIEHYGVVPGLGNLHRRFGLSAAWLTLNALLGVGFAVPFGTYALNGFVAVCFVAWAVGRLPELIATRRVRSVVVTVGLSALVLPLVGRWLSSPASDVTVALFGWTALLLWLGAIEAGRPQRLDAHTLAAVVFAWSAAAIKLSTLPLVFMPVWLTLECARRQRLVIAAVGLIAFAPVILRSVVVSGYLLYPLPIPVLPRPDWAMPWASVREELVWIASWARLPKRPPGVVLRMFPWEWMAAWFLRLPVLERAAVLVVFVGSIGWVVRRLVRGAAAPAARGDVALAATCVGGLAYWFALAPDVRFGWAFVFFTPLLLVATVARAWVARVPLRVWLIGIAAVGVQQGCTMINWSADGVASLRARLVLPIRPPQPPPRMVDLPTWTTFAPQRGDQCWDSPLPCTPYPSPDIERRGPSLADGFRRRSPAGDHP